MDLEPVVSLLTTPGWMQKFYLPLDSAGSFHSPDFIMKYRFTKALMQLYILDPVHLDTRQEHASIDLFIIAWGDFSKSILNPKWRS